MTDTRVKFQTIVKNQLPGYVRDEFPLLGEFLQQYYISQEFQGAPIDLIQNIDRYIKLNSNANAIDSTLLRSDIDSYVDTITVSNTNGFPEEYGLIRIGSEVITYTGKTSTSFTGCIRGFTGYVEDTGSSDFVFSNSVSSTHTKDSVVENLSVDFLSKFFKKVKYQLLPGLEDRTLYSGLNKNLFVKQSKDFYASKGTDESFKILFKALYGEDVEIIKPAENLLTPSQSLYKITKDMVVEPLYGNVMDIRGYTLYQNEYKGIIYKSYAPVVDVERIVVGGATTDYYRISFDANYNRDLRIDGSEYGRFVSHPKTKLIGNYTTSSTTFDVDSTVGFPTSGELSVRYADTTVGVVSYTSKSLTQFYGLTNVSGNIDSGATVGINTYARVTLNDGSVVQVRIVNVLSDLHTGELVGWVNGRPYYGPYHIHRGRKMVGEKHISKTHSYIYETKEDSLSNPENYGNLENTSTTTSGNYSTNTTNNSGSSGGTSGGSSGYSY